MMKKNSIKTVLVGLGITGVVLIGGMSVDLDSPEPINETEKVVVEEECTGEEYYIGSEKTCLSEEAYAIARSLLKTRKLTDVPLYQFTEDGRMHFAIIRHELEEQKKGIVVYGEVTAEKQFDAANKIL